MKRTPQQEDMIIPGINEAHRRASELEVKFKGFSNLKTSNMFVVYAWRLY